VEYLIESKVFQGTPEDIARFLHSAESLNKTMIGDYLGERYKQTNKKEIRFKILKRDEFCIRVLNAFVNKMDFSKFEFDHALR
jgi:brefeldin A-inhibited guanine nucleotide-exchange protein